MRKLKHLQGAEKVDRMFGRMAAEYRRKLTQALNRGTQDVAGAIRSLAPEGEGEGPHIKDDIVTGMIERDDDKAIVGYVVVGTQPETISAALTQEFGRSPGGEGIEGHPGHEPQPFIFAGYQSQRKKVRRRIARAVNAASKDVVRRGG